MFLMPVADTVSISVLLWVHEPDNLLLVKTRSRMFAVALHGSKALVDKISSQEVRMFVPYSVQFSAIL